MNGHGATTELTRAELDRTSGDLLVEFGTTWCGWCRAAQPAIATVLQVHPGVRHVKVEDGPGLPLGRSFRVKLWPTLVLMRDGREVDRVVRPADARTIEAMWGK